MASPLTETCAMRYYRVKQYLLWSPGMSAWYEALAMSAGNNRRWTVAISVASEPATPAPRAF
ncbi:hypothetical protein H9L39_14517 [Fusarium oxysporum f. sp. albedinis]|nr:hypothetical protein H9L39_14517 [Fusarium oxysporum f. sp. albedinis]